MDRTERLERLARAVDELAQDEGFQVGDLPGLGFVRYSSLAGHEVTVYEPVACLVLRGRKRTTAGRVAVDFGPGEALTASHALPVVSRVTECPYLALTISLDIGLMRTMALDFQESATPPAPGASLNADRAEDELIDAVDRYVRLTTEPLHAETLGPLVMKEIHFRLLTARKSGMLRALLHVDSSASHVYRAITEIRRNFREKLSVAHLANTVGMSESALYRHFKTITGTTPIQYQKAMRLQDARRLLVNEGVSVSRAAFAVGYASPTQFSRDFSREFGVPPSEFSGDSQP